MSLNLDTAWRGNDLMVLHRNREVDRIPAADIQRVILVYRGHGDSPGDLAYALFELTDDTVILPAQSGEHQIIQHREAGAGEKQAKDQTQDHGEPRARSLRPGSHGCRSGKGRRQMGGIQHGSTPARLPLAPPTVRGARRARQM